jgi:hypothetical protein
MLAVVGTTLTSTLAGCSGFSPFSSEATVEYDESAIAALPEDIPQVPSAMPVHPTEKHLASARDRIRSLLDGTDVSRIPNAVVREELDRERESARSALSSDGNGESRVEALESLTHPRSEAMFVNAGLAAFDDSLTPTDVAKRREHHHRAAESFLTDYSHIGPPDDPIGAFAEHARIAEWGHTGARITEPKQQHEYENTVLRVAELAQSAEWGRAYAADASRLYEHYTSTIDDPRDFGEHFATVAMTLVDDIASHATPPDWESLSSEIERDIENTPGAKLLEELARIRWAGAQNAVERRDNDRYVGAIVPAMRALTANRAFTDARNAVSNGSYTVPDSVEPIASERAAAVTGFRALLDTSPEPLARRLARYVRSSIQNPDRIVDQNPSTTDGADLYAQYAVANHFASGAPAVVQRVGDRLET